MTLEDLRDYVKARYPSDLTDPEIDQHINEIYKDLAVLWTADTFEEATVTGGTASGQASYTMTTEARRLRSVLVGASETRMRRIQREALAYPRLSGTPTRWYPSGSTYAGGSVMLMFGLDPIPTSSGQAIKCIYEPEPVQLVGDSAAVKYVPEEWQHVIAWGALSLVASKQQDYNVATQWETRFRDTYNELVQRIMGLNQQNQPDAAKGG